MEENKKILVLLKIYNGDLNPFDECALECALSFPNARVSVMSMSPLIYKSTLERLTRLNVESILICDDIYRGSDTIVTSKILSKAIEYYGFDLVFTGRESMDGNTGQVPLMISQLLNFNLVNRVIQLEDNKVLTRNNEVVVIDRNQLVTFEKFKLLRSPSIFSKASEVKIINNQILNLNPKEVGLVGSPTRVIKSYKNQKDRRICEYISIDKLDEVISNSLNKKSILCEEEVSKVDEIYYVGNLKEVANKYSKTSYELKGRDVDTLLKEIELLKPKIILWEENDEIKALASKIAILTQNGLCADCTSFSYINNQFVITRPALGGDIIADIICTSSISMASIKAPNNDSNNVAFIVGNGAKEYLDKIEFLAEKYGGIIYCTRPLADSGIIDYSKQVGLTGITISPKVCVTFGVSGAIQTIAGIKSSNTIIAINNDRKAGIFDYADYGIVMDIKNI